MRALAKSPLSSRAEHLKGVSLFADVQESGVVLENLAAELVERDFAPGESILVEGEPGAEFYILVDGVAGVYRRTPEGDTYKVASLNAQTHAFFGEGALLDSESRSATIKAETNCRCLVLSRKTFEEFSAKHPEWSLPIVRRIARAVLARLRKSNDDLMLLYKALIAEIRGS